MQIYKTQTSIASKSSWLLSIVVVILITMGVMILLQALSLFLIPPIFGIPVDEFASLFSGQSSHPNGRMAFLFLQGLGSGVSFIIATWILVKFVDKADLGLPQQLERFHLLGLILLILVMFGGIAFNSALIDWNASIRFPEFMREVETMFRQKEDELMALTKYITDFENSGEFWAGLLVIGVLAGLGEEVFFRGMIQPKMQIYTGNPHVAIWLTAIIFSAIHLQFYGFLPRMVLGALFGYLYFFSGSLVYPIIAHILNNSFTVVLLYLNKIGKLEYDLEATDQIHWGFALLGLILLLFAMKVFKEKHQPIESHE